MPDMTCPRCVEVVLADRHPWVLNDDGSGRARIFDNDIVGEPGGSHR